MKFTKPEARYLVRSARETLRWARRYESTIKLYISSGVVLFDSRLVSASAAVVDTRRRDAAERMKLAKEIEAKK